jgi:hypothetical protein
LNEGPCEKLKGIAEPSSCGEQEQLPGKKKFPPAARIFQK